MAVRLRDRSEPATGHRASWVLPPGTAGAACDRLGCEATAGDATAHDAGAARGTAGTPGSPVAAVTTSTERLMLGLDDEITFGRGGDVRVRIGHMPVDDRLVAPVVGALFVRDDRVVVANRGPRLAFDIAVPDRPLLPVSPGDWHSPVDPTFAVVVQGTLRYQLDVESTLGGHRFAALPAGEPARGAGSDHAGSHVAGPASGGTTGGVPDLTERQRAILDAYVAPMADGLPPATHQQVADVIACCRQTVRLECTNIFEAFLEHGVPMRDWRAARDAITDAWARHRL